MRAMREVNQAYHRVRKELADLGLLLDGWYLDHVELWVDGQRSTGESGYVFEKTGPFRHQGYRPGVIYLPRDLPSKARTPGCTLTDIIRHEFAHAWHYLDCHFFRQGWFEPVFDASYGNCQARPYQRWKKRLSESRRYRVETKRCRSEQSMERVRSRRFRDHFITDYAATCECEDFAETFMFFLKYRNSLDRFASRPGVYRKLRAVERAIGVAARHRRSIPARRDRIRSA
ncbi:MAG: hypothetical protein ACK56Q_11735 [Pirellulaceae bacterium]